VSKHLFTVKKNPKVQTIPCADKKMPRSVNWHLARIKDIGIVNHCKIDTRSMHAKDESSISGTII
jgi:hypothetical protein